MVMLFGLQLTNHGFTGNGALIKISDGQNFILEKIDLMNI